MGLDPKPIDVEYFPPSPAPVRYPIKRELKLVPKQAPAGRTAVRGIRRQQRLELSDAEALLTELFEGTLEPADYQRVIPFHCLDERYKKCDSFMRRFYVLGYGGFAPGPSMGAFGDGIATLCFLSADGPSLGRGAPVAAVIGEHEDCGLSKMETGSYERSVIEKRTIERTDSHLAALFSRNDIAPALRTGRLSVVITRTTFIREADGKYSIAYRILPERTNDILLRAGQPALSKSFTGCYSDETLVFGKWGARGQKCSVEKLIPR